MNIEDALLTVISERFPRATINDISSHIYIMDHLLESMLHELSDKYDRGY